MAQPNRSEIVTKAWIARRRGAAKEVNKEEKAERREQRGKGGEEGTKRKRSVSLFYSI